MNKFITNKLENLFEINFIVRNGLYRAIREHSLKFEGSTLDVGCGQKPYEMLFSKTTKYVGVDVEISGHNHVDSKVDIYYNGLNLPFPDNAFDNIVCFEVLEHVKNPLALITEMSRVLRPKGYLLITTPFVYPEHETPFDFQRITRYQFLNYKTDCNLDIIESKTTSNFLTTLIQLLCLYLSELRLFKFRITYRILITFIIFPLNLLSLITNRKKTTSSFYLNTVILFCKN